MHFGICSHFFLKAEKDLKEQLLSLILYFIQIHSLTSWLWIDGVFIIYLFFMFWGGVGASLISHCIWMNKCIVVAVDSLLELAFKFRQTAELSLSGEW